MIETDKLTSVEFSDFPDVMPSTWYLGNFIPGGALDASHVEARVRPANSYWLPWGPVDGWDQTTKTATFFRPVDADKVAFRRVTPKYAPWKDPQAPTSRVSERDLQINADQGLFCTIEWAAQYGIDAKRVLLPNPDNARNKLGLILYTQNHWGPDADYGKKTWNFQFSGGYLDRAHVKVQARLNGVWTQLTVDTSEYDHLDPSNAPFRFIGPYQLHLDLATLGGVVDGLIIYRFTPRSVNVESPDDAEKIVADNMKPSATHSFFVAAEVGEELAKWVPTCTCGDVYYTSTLYPIFFEDSLGLAAPTYGYSTLVEAGSTDRMALEAPVLSGGTLVGVLGPYTNWRDVNPDKLGIAAPVVSSGTLVSSAVIYTNWRDVVPEKIGLAAPTFVGSSTLIVNGINYVNWRDVVPEKIGLAAPVATSGTLV